MAGSDHIQPLRLFELSQAEARHSGFQLTEEEKQHLRGCENCLHVLEVFSRQFAKTPGDEPGNAA